MIVEEIELPLTHLIGAFDICILINEEHSDIDSVELMLTGTQSRHGDVIVIVINTIFDIYRMLLDELIDILPLMGINDDSTEKLLAALLIARLIAKIIRAAPENSLRARLLNIIVMIFCDTCDDFWLLCHQFFTKNHVFTVMGTSIRHENRYHEQPKLTHWPKSKLRRLCVEATIPNTQT